MLSAFEKEFLMFLKEARKANCNGSVEGLGKIQEKKKKDEGLGVVLIQNTENKNEQSK